MIKEPKEPECRLIVEGSIPVWAAYVLASLVGIVPVVCALVNMGFF